MGLEPVKCEMHKGHPHGSDIFETHFRDEETGEVAKVSGSDDRARLAYQDAITAGVIDEKERRAIKPAVKKGKGGE